MHHVEEATGEVVITIIYISVYIQDSHEIGKISWFRFDAWFCRQHFVTGSIPPYKSII